jgi:hypothetical protein
MKNHGYSGNYEMVMNLAQAMLEGCVLEALFSEGWAQESKNKTRKARYPTQYNERHLGE